MLMDRPPLDSKRGGRCTLLDKVLGNTKNTRSKASFFTSDVSPHMQTHNSQQITLDCVYGER